MKPTQTLLHSLGTLNVNMPGGLGTPIPKTIPMEKSSAGVPPIPTMPLRKK